MKNTQRLCFNTDPLGENSAESSVHHYQRPENSVHSLPGPQDAQQLHRNNSKWGSPAKVCGESGESETYRLGGWMDIKVQCGG